MAERKVYDFDNEYNYDAYTDYNETAYYDGYADVYPNTQDDGPVPQETIVESTKQVEHVSPLPMNPRGKLSKITRYERAVAITILFVFVAFAVAQIFVSTKISSTQNQITTIQAEINSKNDKIDELKQQRNELLRADRVKKIASDRGLSVNENNIRNVR
jgi:cell division protein FtsL